MKKNDLKKRRKTNGLETEVPNKKNKETIKKTVGSSAEEEMS